MLLFIDTFHLENVEYISAFLHKNVNSLTSQNTIIFLCYWLLDTPRVTEALTELFYTIALHIFTLEFPSSNYKKTCIDVLKLCSLMTFNYLLEPHVATILHLCNKYLNESIHSTSELIELYGLYLDVATELKMNTLELQNVKKLFMKKL